MRFGGVLKVIVVISIGVISVLIILQLLEINVDFNLPSVFERKSNSVKAPTRPPRFKCGLSKPCPEGHFAFKIASGAASVVGPKICVEDDVLMSGVKNNVGRGINIALLNGRTGELLKTDSFDMWAGDVNALINFLKTIEDGTVVMMATFDDPFTKLNGEAKKMIADLGSSSVHSLGFRDNWIFVGGKGIKAKSPFEQVRQRRETSETIGSIALEHIKNNAETNKYEGWPEVLEMEGCIPARQG